MAITIHLIVRYRELAGLNPNMDQRQLVLDSTIFMARPCTFAVLTTVVGFGSLVLSGILPVRNRCVALSDISYISGTADTYAKGNA